MWRACRSSCAFRSASHRCRACSIDWARCAIARFRCLPRAPRRWARCNTRRPSRAAPKRSRSCINSRRRVRQTRRRVCGRWNRRLRRCGPRMCCSMGARGALRATARRRLVGRHRSARARPAERPLRAISRSHCTLVRRNGAVTWRITAPTVPTSTMNASPVARYSPSAIVCDSGSPGVTLELIQLVNDDGAPQD